MTAQKEESIASHHEAYVWAALFERYFKNYPDEKEDINIHKRIAKDAEEKGPYSLIKFMDTEGLNPQKKIYGGYIVNSVFGHFFKQMTENFSELQEKDFLELEAQYKRSHFLTTVYSFFLWDSVDQKTYHGNYLHGRVSISPNGENQWDVSFKRKGMDNFEKTMEGDFQFAVRNIVWEYMKALEDHLY
ncbi:hypothetical protein GF420_15685 [candidate division GN15 bacterium]|nr:hypothetical protein [candidate division GN15 bacterium]